MERNREARRVSMAGTNGLGARRRHGSCSLRDSPEDDRQMELSETARLRDRGMGKRDRDRERDRDRGRDRERDRERERDRDRDRMSSRGKRRRAERLMHGINREDAGEDSSEESVNDDEDDDDDDGGLGSSMRMLPPNPSTLSSSSLSNHHHRKSFPPPAKAYRASPPATVATTWKAPDEMIGVLVPRKARSASTKRSNEWASSCGVGLEQIHRQASTSPVRSSGPSVAAMLVSASASPAPAPVSPSSSNVSVKKKMKPNGPKQRPPKSSSKFTSSTQEEIEIEIAEVLYGLMRQPQGPKQEVTANDSVRFDNTKSNGDAKSRVSSPISNSQSIIPQSTSIPPTNSSSSVTPMSAIASKRKKPRPINYEDENPSAYPARNSPVSFTIKVDVDQPAKTESTPNLEKNSEPAADNGTVSQDVVASEGAEPPPSEPQLQPELLKLESNPLSVSKQSTYESEGKDLVVNKEQPLASKRESPPGLKQEEDRECVTATKPNSVLFEIETQREEKFQIDLMAPPPLRSSPERDREIDYVAVDPKPETTDVSMETKPVVKEDNNKAVKIGNDVNVEAEDKKAKAAAEEVESQKPTVASNKEKSIDPQLDLEQADRDGGNTVHQNVQKQKQSNNEKAAQSSSLPLPMSMASWPGGLPHMGYMAPLQGVVSMDGSAVPSAAMQPPHLLFSQPRAKRCATHCYVARNILCHQQITRMNPFWPAAGSALPFGAKACNVNAVPSTDLHTGRGVNSVQDKGQGLASFPSHTGKDKSSQNSNIVDAAQRKQILLQQSLPPGTSSNMLHGPAFIFPLNQQQAAAAAAAVRSGTGKSPSVLGTASSSSTSGSASVSATATAVAGATAMSFNYPNIPGSETQYLAILQNSAYPIPIPAHVSATPSHRGAPPQAMPFFNGSFYPSQMIHPPQLQQQQSSTQHNQQGQQNPSISSGSSSSQKHLQNQQQRPHGAGINGASGNLQGFPTSKNQQSQSLQRQQMQNQNIPHQARQLESELGSEDGPSTADSCVPRANMSIYGQNFGMPIHPQNFPLMTPPTIGGTTNVSGNPGEKKQQQTQPQSSKVGIEPSQAFAMSFASINGATAAPGLDISSIAQNHAILHNLPEAARHGYHFMTAAAAAQAAQQKKNHRTEGKTGGNDSSNVKERKTVPVGKAQAIPGQSVGLSWSDLTDTSILSGNNVIDSSARSLNLGSASARASGSVTSAPMSTVNTSSAQQQQLQRNQQQMIQFQKQQQFAAAAAAACPASVRNKTPATSNGSVYSDHIASSSPMAAKVPNALSWFPPNLVQGGSSSPGQSQQWKNSVRTNTTSQIPSPSLASVSSSLKNQGLMQQGHTQINFAATPKPVGLQQAQPAAPTSNQSPSPSVMVGSPSNSSMSKSAGGSPRTSASTSNKGGQSSTLSSQPTKNSPSAPPQKSSPVGGRNIPSILGHPHNATSSSKSQSQLAAQQQLSKHAMQQTQFYSGYMQAQVPNSTHASAASGFYLQRHRGDQLQQPTTSTGMMLCPTTDPAKAVAAAAVAAAAASNMKGGGLSQHGLIHAQFAAAQSSRKPHIASAGFPYVHPVPAVQVKPAEQKQPAAE